MEQNPQIEVFTHCHLATMDATKPGIGIVRDGAIVSANGTIVWCGAAADLPEKYSQVPARDLGGRWVLPALIDCHSHLVYAGNRVGEFEQRLQGASYAQIAKAGGGIVSTVQATRAASLEELIAVSRPRLDQMRGFGVGTVEIKSGYGLTVQDEIKMLRAARALGEAAGGERSDMRVSTSFLGAHALPPEFAGRADEYVDLLVGEMLPEIARLGLADAVDAFCEGIGFSAKQTRRVLVAAVDLGLPIRLHAEQLSNLHGAQMAAELGALSCDHLEYLDEAGARAMAAAGSVAVLLPGAFYFLNETKRPPVDLLREVGVPMALATDCNPGSSPTTCLPLMISMGCTLFGFTVDEALIAVTRAAAFALGLGDKIGQIAPGFSTELSVFDLEHPAELAYGFGQIPPMERI